MMTGRLHRRRGGVIVVEGAFVHPVMIFLLIGAIVVGMGVFRYQQVNFLVSEAARAFAVRGKNWSDTNHQPPAMTADIVKSAVLPLAVGIDPNAVAVDAVWINRVTGEQIPWDTSPRTAEGYNAQDGVVANHVRVTLTYRWSPAVFFSQSLTMTGVSEQPLFN